MDSVPGPTRPLKLMTLCQTGYWFCKVCNRIVGIEYDDSQEDHGQLPKKSCAICGSPRVEWNAPALPPDKEPNGETGTQAA